MNQRGHPKLVLSLSKVTPAGRADGVTPQCVFTHPAQPVLTSLPRGMPTARFRQLGPASGAERCPEPRPGLPPHGPFAPGLSKRHWQEPGKDNSIVSTCRGAGEEF